jgi:hypothetical protein
MEIKKQMKFDTSRSDGVMGVSLLSVSGAYGFAVILMQIIDPVAMGLVSAIMLIVGAIIFGIGAILLVMNGQATGDIQVNPGSSMLAQGIFLLCMFLIVIGGIFVAL